MQNEEAALRAARTRAGDGTTAGGAPAWNHAEFVVRYPSLDKHLAVGGVYLNLLLDGADQASFDDKSESCCWTHELFRPESFTRHRRPAP